MTDERAAIADDLGEEPWPERGLVYFRPGEISLLLRTADRTAEQLLPTLRALLHRAEIKLDERPLRRPNGRSNRECITLPRPGDGLRLLTLNLSGWRENLDDQANVAALRACLAETARAVRDLGRMSAEALRIEDVEIVGAAPNWLTGPFDYCGCFAPAARPLPAKAKPFEPFFNALNPPRFRPVRRYKRDVGRVLSETLFALTGAHPRGDGVDIAIFDTWPLDAAHPGSLGVIRHRLNVITQKLEADNTPPEEIAARTRLLAAAAHGEVAPKEFVFDFFGKYASIDHAELRRRTSSGMGEPSYKKPDHGLFIADMIKDLAPRAQLSVYRVLNDSGIGELDTLARAVAHALANRRPGRRLVLNFSGGLAPQLAVLGDLLKEPLTAYDHPADWMKAIVGSPTDADTVLGRLEQAGVWGNDQPRRYGGALSTVNWLFSGEAMPRGVLTVASSGNDSLPDSVLPPRLPAAVPGVLGVYAVQNDGDRASYSNRPDIPLPGERDGIGAYGGSQPGEASEDGPVALYVSEHLPPIGGAKQDGAAKGDAMNDLGLAIWCGTSFATAIASGFAACVWSTNLSQSADTLVQQLTKWAEPIAQVRQQA